MIVKKRKHTDVEMSQPLNIVEGRRDDILEVDDERENEFCIMEITGESDGTFNDATALELRELNRGKLSKDDKKWLGEMVSKGLYKPAF